MKIVKLAAENIKRIVAVEITPEENLVEISGKNGAGKSSCLDAIWWALAGASAIQKKPIRESEREARISLDLGEIVVRRDFRLRDDGEVTTRVTVSAGDSGAHYPSPQALLDGLLGSLTLDPLAFARMHPREQKTALAESLGIDLERYAADEAAAMTARREVGREIRALKAQRDGISVLIETPIDPINISDLLRRIESGAAKNAALTAERARRAADERRVSDISRARDAHRAKAEELRQRAGEEDQAAAALDHDLLRLQVGISNLPPLEDDFDPAPLHAEIEKAEATNEHIRQARARRKICTELDDAQARHDGYQRRIDAIVEARKEAIMLGGHAVPGMTLGDDGVTLDGVPFEQASDAAKLRASCGLAMAAGSKLRVLRVRDGSLLDSASMELLARMADEHDYQIWIERVSDGTGTGIIIEDGMLAGSAANAEKMESADE